MTPQTNNSFTSAQLLLFHRGPTTPPRASPICAVLSAPYFAQRSKYRLSLYSAAQCTQTDGQTHTEGSHSDRQAKADTEARHSDKSDRWEKTPEPGTLAGRQTHRIKPATHTDETHRTQAPRQTDKHKEDSQPLRQITHTETRPPDRQTNKQKTASHSHR